MSGSKSGPTKEPSKGSSQAVPPGPTPAAGDPSMEDILASIRRILSEDEPPAAEPEPRAAEAPAAGQGGVRREDKPEEKDVLVLDPSMMVEEPKPNAPVEHVMTQEARTEPAHLDNPAPAASPARADGGLVAPEAAAAAASSVGSLVRALTDRSTHVHHGGPTIEDLVRDEIRPVLKQWLDTHLPPLVERLVRIEIERVVGRVGS